MMEQMMIYMIVSVVGFWIGCKFTQFWMSHTFRDILNDLGVTPRQLHDLAAEKGVDLPELDVEPEKKELPTLEIRIEQHGDVLYAYRLDNDQFLAQGGDREALLQRLTETLTNVRVIVDRDHGADFLKS